MWYEWYPILSWRMEGALDQRDTKAVRWTVRNRHQVPVGLMLACTPGGFRSGRRNTSRRALAKWRERLTRVSLRHGRRVVHGSAVAVLPHCALLADRRAPCGPRGSGAGGGTGHPAVGVWAIATPECDASCPWHCLALLLWRKGSSLSVLHHDCFICTSAPIGQLCACLNGVFQDARGGGDSVALAWWFSWSAACGKQESVRSSRLLRMERRVQSSSEWRALYLFAQIGQRCGLS